MSKKEYGAYAPTRDGKMVAVATTVAESKEDAARVLSRFTSAADIREMKIKEMEDDEASHSR